MNKKVLSFLAAIVVVGGSTILVSTAAMLAVAGTAVGIALALALTVFGGMAILLTIEQLRFGLTADRLHRRLVEEGDARAQPNLPTLPSGRVEPTIASNYLAARTTALEADPGDWRLWYLQAAGLEITRSHRRAVAALARAKHLERQCPDTQVP